MPTSEQIAALSPRRWFWLSLAITIAAGSLAVLGTVSLNLYGLYGDVRGKSYRVLSVDDRWSKYLLSMNYVPANFDAILVGSSKTQNWDTSRMTVAKVYNGSIEGANITEAKSIAENLLAKRKLRLVIFSIWPYMTATAGFKSGELTPAMYYGSFGSLRLYRSYADYLLFLLHRANFDTTPAGTERVKPLEPFTTLWQQNRPMPTKSYYPGGFKINPAAYQQYAALIIQARQNGAQLVRFRPPVFKQDYEPFQQEWKTYEESMDKLFAPTDPLIDFLTPEYAAFRADRSNFIDGAHLTSKAGDWLIDEMDRQLRPLIK